MTDFQCKSIIDWSIRVADISYQPVQILWLDAMHAWLVEYPVPFLCFMNWPLTVTCHGQQSTRGRKKFPVPSLETGPWILKCQLYHNRDGKWSSSTIIKERETTTGRNKASEMLLSSVWRMYAMEGAPESNILRRMDKHDPETWSGI